jgi:hypothetical protein
MLCRRCSDLLPERRPPYGGALRVGAVAGVLCARCGTVLGPESLTGRLVAKLAQLNRFGLAGRDELLRPAPPPQEDS